MRILVSITNFGMKNVEYARRIIQEYESMPFDVDIVVLSEAHKDYGNNVKVLVGLSSKDPWSLPFGHKKLFADNIDKYDLFIYTEDDTLIRKENILAFLEASEAIGDEFLPGFIRYELYPDGKKNYTDSQGPYRWIPGSVRKSGKYTLAEFTNAHSACYILTQAQLCKALASGGFLVPPHSGRYDMLCSAATDPYTQCGFTKVICLSHLQDFELYHLSNRYVDQVGLDEDRYKLQIAALLEILDQKRPIKELFVAEKCLSTLAWDKSYYEACRYDLLRFIPPDAKEVLSIGCGWGSTENHLKEQGKRVVVVPLDSVIAKLLETTVTTLPADFGLAFGMLAERQFDAIILSEVLQHLPYPIEILSKLGAFLSKHGILIGSVPNLSLSRRLTGRLLGNSERFAHKFARISGSFNETNLHLTSVPMINGWIKASGLHPLDVHYEDLVSAAHLSRALALSLPKEVSTRSVVFVAERGAL